MIELISKAADGGGGGGGFIGVGEGLSFPHDATNKAMHSPQIPINLFRVFNFYYFIVSTTTEAGGKFTASAPLSRTASLKGAGFIFSGSLNEL